MKTGLCSSVSADRPNSLRGAVTKNRPAVLGRLIYGTTASNSSLKEEQLGAVFSPRDATRLLRLHLRKIQHVSWPRAVLDHCFTNWITGLGECEDVEHLTSQQPANTPHLHGDTRRQSGLTVGSLSNTPTCATPPERTTGPVDRRCLSTK